MDTARRPWWRTPAWGPEGAERLEQELDHAAPWTRAHRLRVKAHALLLTREPALERAATALLLRVLAEHPDDLDEVAAAHRLLGHVRGGQGRDADAERHLRRALAAEYEHGAVCTDTALALAELLVRSPDGEKRREAESLLHACERQAGTLLVFPEARFRHAATAARLARLDGDRRLAASYARAALREPGGADAATLHELQSMLARAA